MRQEVKESIENKTLVEALDHLEKVVENMIWMSGSEDFGINGQAYDGWSTKARPALFEAIDFLERVGE